MAVPFGRTLADLLTGTIDLAIMAAIACWLDGGSGTGSSALPRLRETAVDDERGRGLQIVSGLADLWARGAPNRKGRLVRAAKSRA
jgi:hypothetical protein